MEHHSKPTAFVLSGGASLGAIQVGMLHALYERQIKPDFIAAASVGALNGAFIAARPQDVATTDELARIWIDLRRGNVFPLNPLTGLFGFAGLRRHMVPDHALRTLIDQHLTTDRLEQASDPLARHSDRRAHWVGGEALAGSAARSNPRKRRHPWSSAKCRLAGPRADGWRCRDQHPDQPRDPARSTANLRPADDSGRASSKPCLGARLA